MTPSFSLILALTTAATHAATTPTAPHDHSQHSAPAGVMFAHQMPADSWALGTRNMFQSSQGMLQGTTDISPTALYATEAIPGSNYHAAPVEMTMNMTMLDVMWAPTDTLTLMLMTQYNTMSMTMQQGPKEPGAEGSEHGHGGGGGGHSPGTRHQHTVSGWGDTSLTAAIRLLAQDAHHLHLTLGLSAPTGSVSRRGKDGKPVHYMMQPGSGTWDSLTGLTYTGHSSQLFWGAQYMAQVRLQDAGDSGFRIGDQHNTTAWIGTQLTPWASLTARANWRHEGSMRGHYNGPHNHGAPPDLTKNYGGDWVELGLGTTLRLSTNWNLGIEALIPVYQDVLGIQPKRDFSINASLQLKF
jgi:hypothetical protein